MGTGSMRAALTPHAERVGLWPVGFALSFPQDSGAERVYAGDDSLQVAIERKSRPALPDDVDEEVIARWVALNGLMRDPECEVIGTIANDGNSAHGRVAVGTARLLLTDRFLRCTMPRNDSRVMVRPPKLQPLSQGWTYAFVLDLVDVDFVRGGGKMVAFGSSIEALSVQSVVRADEDWNYETRYKGCAEFAVELMTTILNAKEIYGDDRQRDCAAAVASTDYHSKLTSRWKPAKFDF
jgi:hypothetical protein